MTDLPNQRNQRKRLPSYVALTVNNFCKCNAIIRKYSTAFCNIFKSISRSQYLASHLDLATRLRSSARETIFAILDARPSLLLPFRFVSCSFCVAPAQKHSPTSVTRAIRPTTFDSGGSRCFPSVRQSFRS